MARSIMVLAALAAVFFVSPCSADEIPISDFVRYPSYSGVKISPTGEYLAMTVDRGDQDVLAVLRTGDLGVVSVTELPGKHSVGRFYWGNPKRLVFNTYVKTGRYALQQPPSLGYLYAIDIDGSKPRRLMYEPRTATERAARSTREDTEGLYEVLDALPDDDDQVLIRIVNPFLSEKKLNRIGLLNTGDGRVKVLASAPRGKCRFAIDGLKRPRFAMCGDEEEDGGIHAPVDVYRLDGSGGWKLIHNQKDSEKILDVIGGAADGRIYANLSDGKGTLAFGTVDASTGEFHRLFKDPVSDPSGYIESAQGDTVLAVVTRAGKPRITMLEESHSDVDLYESLAASFPDQFVEFSSSTRDGGLVVFSVRSDRNPGELYLYDRQTKKARFLMRSMKWIDPGRMAEVRPLQFTSRDGLKIHGYLTIPNGSSGRNLPMIVNVHGGPMGVRDDWHFNSENQLLASRGYLVLQVNYRGSGGFGPAFENMAYGQWADGIINDVVDATRWAVEKGHADKDRICIYGGSYGGYAAMMAPAKAKGLYRCAFGYVGAYDMEVQMTKSDISRRESGLRYLERALGETKSERDAISPVNHAGAIGIPVYLAAGAADQRCPPENTEAMEKALIAAGNTPEGVMIQAGEGHGFYKEENNFKLYTEMLTFFDRHVGAKH